jgi:hypothetical protein
MTGSTSIVLKRRVLDRGRGGDGIDMREAKRWKAT